MASRLRALVFESTDPQRPAEFWAGLLDRPMLRDGESLLLPGTPGQIALRFVAAESAKIGPNPLHLHLTGDERPPAGTVAAARERGATLLDLGNPDDADFVVLADPDGNEFCVLDGGNAWVAGCGYLGEVACDGSRAVGLFWAAALRWPLVWDEGAETAVQSPDGGTKISWGGEDPPAEPRTSRQHFALVVGEPECALELTRLESLGATVIGATSAQSYRLADPDGGVFTLTCG